MDRIFIYSFFVFWKQEVGGTADHDVANIQDIVRMYVIIVQEDITAWTDMWTEKPHKPYGGAVMRYCI